MCGVGEQVRKKQQRLLKNMDAHKVMLDLLQIPYEKVGGWSLSAQGAAGTPVLQRGRRGSTAPRTPSLTSSGLCSPLLRGMPR